jgi:monoterpene epsilon-lactone hydrolase
MDSATYRDAIPSQEPTMNRSTESPTLPLRERRHALPAAERAAEQAVLASLAAHFAGFQGSLRESYDAMTAMTPMAAGVAFEEVDDVAVKGWWCRPAGAPADRAILFVHGGAYMLGSARAYRGLASHVAARAGVAVFVPDYPLAPERPFPAAYDATVAARRWLGARGLAQIALAGDSAGAGLVLATLAGPVAGSPPVRAVVAFSPWTDLALGGPSFNDPATHDPVFKPPVLAGAAKAYLSGADPRDGRASPLHAIPADLPPLLVQVGTDELLRDDALRYAALAAQKGAEVRLDVFEGLHHVFQRAVAELPSAARALDDAAEFVRANWRD